MTKIIITLGLALLSISFCYSQTKPPNEESKKFGSYLLESVYITRAFLPMPLTEECLEIVKKRIFNISKTLKTTLDNNKKLIIQKIGSEETSGLEFLIKGYAKYAESSEYDEPGPKRIGFAIWLDLWKIHIEKLFIKLNK